MSNLWKLRYRDDRNWYEVVFHETPHFLLLCRGIRRRSKDERYTFSVSADNLQVSINMEEAF